LVHPRGAERLEAAGKAIAERAPGAVGLQEVWFDGDADRLRRLSGLPHMARVRRGVAFGTGLAILSNWPVLESEEKRFSVLTPSWARLAQGEPAVRKGWLRARLATPWGEFDAYSAHMLSDYPGSKYRSLRALQLFELAEDVLDRSKGRPFAIMADFNAGRGDPDFDAFLDLLGAWDPCAPKGAEVCGDPGRGRPGDRRIDFVLLSARARAKGARTLDGTVPGKGELRLSDHAGFSAEVEPAPGLWPGAAPEPARRAAALERTIATIDAFLAAERRPGRWIPLYGWLAARRERAQAAALAVLRERAVSARARLSAPPTRPATATR
jgi:endonuclease/exonuclease/phosphatase family metal-dependent hydrolase